MAQAEMHQVLKKVSDGVSHESLHQMTWSKLRLTTTIGYNSSSEEEGIPVLQGLYGR